ncbi:MAG: helix-turn-helix domain-containing protein [bacterium]
MGRICKNLISKITHPGNATAVPANGLIFQKKYSVKEASKLMGIGATTLRRIIQAGKIPVIWINGKVLVSEIDLEAFLTGNYGLVSVSAATSYVSEPKALSPLPDSIANSKFFKKAS